MTTNGEVSEPLRGQLDVEGPPLTAAAIDALLTCRC